MKRTVLFAATASRHTLCKETDSQCLSHFLRTWWISGSKKDELSG